MSNTKINKGQRITKDLSVIQRTKNLAKGTVNEDTNSPFCSHRSPSQERCNSLFPILFDKAVEKAKKEDIFKKT